MFVEGDEGRVKGTKTSMHGRANKIGVEAMSTAGPRRGENIQFQHHAPTACIILLYN